MSQLLKSVWRNVLRGSMPSLRTMSTGLTEVSPKSPDLIMASIKSASTPALLFEQVQHNGNKLTHKHMLQALRRLFEMHKAGKLDYGTENLLKDPAFYSLCNNFKRHARALDTNDAIEAIKVLTFLNVAPTSVIVQSMLQIIRCQINDLNIRQVIFLDFLLGQFENKSHLVDAIKFALPLVFQIHLPLELDKQDLPLLKDMLAFCCKHNLPDRCINNIVTALLLHDQTIDAKIARNIVWSLCELNCTQEVYPTRVQLLHICFDILTQRLDQLCFDDVLRTSAKIKGRVVEKHPEYYHEQLMDAVAEYVIRNGVDFEKGLLIARILSRMAHTHLGLIEYLCSKAVSTPGRIGEARTNILFGFINCLANNNYNPPPEQWSEMRRQISSNPVLNVTSTALPWAKFCLELASLGHYEDKLLSRVFSEAFLKEYLDRESNNLDYLQLMTLYLAVTTFHCDKYDLPKDVLNTAKDLYPTHKVTDLLEEGLVRGLGDADCVAKNVVLPCGIITDLLVCLRGGYPVKMLKNETSGKIPIEELGLPEDGVIICVMNFSQGCFSMNSNRLRGTFRLILDILEKKGYITVPVNVNEWLQTPSYERTPYLMREIGYKCGELGMKLCAT